MATNNLDHHFNDPSFVVCGLLLKKVRSEDMNHSTKNEHAAMCSAHWPNTSPSKKNLIGNSFSTSEISNGIEILPENQNRWWENEVEGPLESTC